MVITEMKSLITFLQDSFSPGKELIQAISEMAKKREFQKNEMVFQQGFPANGEFFVESGMIRAFITDSEGNEQNRAFYQAGDFMGISSMRTQNDRSIYGYQALKESLLLRFDSHKLMNLSERFPDFVKALKSVKDRESERILQRENCLLPSGAAEKYKRFQEYFPEYSQEISHYHIASYLGITPVTLSRIRNPH